MDWRRATRADEDEVLALALELRKRTWHQHVALDMGKLSNTYRVLRLGSDNLVLVAVREEKIVGTLWGVSRPMFYSQECQAVDLMTYATYPGAGLGLIRRFVEWAKRQPSVRCLITGMSVDLVERDAIDHVYRAAGLAPMGAGWGWVRKDEARRRSA